MANDTPAYTPTSTDAATAVPRIAINAGNDSPGTTRPETGISVVGFNFPPGATVNVDAEGHKGTAVVKANGEFTCEITVRPPLGCGSLVSATAQVEDGISVDGQGEVFCP